MHIGWFDSCAAYGTAKITDLSVCVSACTCKWAAEESAVAAQVIRQSQLKERFFLFLEGIGIWHLGPIRQMSPYGRPSRRYFTDTKGQWCHLGFGGELSVLTAVFPSATLGQLGEANMMRKRVSYAPKWIRQYINTKERIAFVRTNGKPQKELNFRGNVFHLHFFQTP